LASPPQHSWSCPWAGFYGGNALVISFALWSCCPCAAGNGMFSVFMEVATRKRHMKFAPSFTLTPSITLFNVPYIYPHIRHSFRIWFQEKKYLCPLRNLLLNPFLSHCGNRLWFTCLFFISMILNCSCNCNLLTFLKTFSLHAVSYYFWHEVEIGELNK
jgi:hypothetical protein